MELLTEHGADGTNVAELGHRHQRMRDPHRQHPRGREDPRHRPRRLRRLGGDRRHGPGAGPPRLRGDAADRGDRRRARSCGPASWSSERWHRRCSPSPTSPRVATRRGSTPCERAFSDGRRPARSPHRPRPQPDRLHPRGRAGGARPRRWPRGAAEAIRSIDMTAYEGVHPAIGALDVCPVVWIGPEDRERGASGGGRASPAGSASSAFPSSSTASWRAGPSGSSGPTSATAG